MTFSVKRLFIYVLVLYISSYALLIDAQTTTSKNPETTTEVKTTSTPQASSQQGEIMSSQPIAGQKQGEPVTQYKFPTDKYGNILPPPTGPDGLPLPVQVDKNGNIIHPKFEDNGDLVVPQLDIDGDKVTPQLDKKGNIIEGEAIEIPNPYQGQGGNGFNPNFPPPPPPPPYYPTNYANQTEQASGNETKTETNTDNKMFTYLIILSAIVFIIVILLLVYVFKYKKSINGKIKRLEQVKDMQSLEASNTRPLTTVSPSGFLEDKRDVYSSNSSAKKTPLYTESSMKSTTSDASIYDEAINYITEMDYNGGRGYSTNAGYVSSNVGYVSPGQVLVNKNMGNYNPYDNTYLSSPSSLGVIKNDYDALYSRNLDQYDTDDAVIVSPGTQNLVYEANGGLTPIIGTPYSNAMASNSMASNSMAMLGGNNSLARNRNYNSSVPSVQSLGKVAYDTDLAYNSNYSGQMKYSTISPVQTMTPISPISPISPASQKTMVAGYQQARMDPRATKRRSHSIDITKSKRNSYVENMGKRSPGLYAPHNGSPIMPSKGSVVSETRSAKSVLIDQMVQAMDMEAESDDTLSNYVINDTASKASSVRAKIVNIPPKETMQIKKNTTTYPKAKITPVSSSSSLVNNSITEKTLANEEIKEKDASKLQKKKKNSKGNLLVKKK